MLEIFMIIFLTRRVGEIVKGKNRNPGWYKVMTVVLWLGGEFAGALVGGVVVALTGANQLFIYLLALVGAGLGAGIAFAVAKAVPASEPYGMMQPPPPPTFG